MDPDLVSAKARAAVGFHQREVDALELAISNLDEKQAKHEAMLAGIEESREAHLADLKAARERLEAAREAASGINTSAGAGVASVEAN